MSRSRHQRTVAGCSTMPAPRPVSGSGERSSTVTSHPRSPRTCAAVSPPSDPPATRTLGRRLTRPTLVAPPDRVGRACDRPEGDVHTRPRPRPPPPHPRSPPPLPDPTPPPPLRPLVPLPAAVALAMAVSLAPAPPGGAATTSA